MTISTACPPVTDLRYTLERHILDLYESDGSTLKSSAQWPGFYTLPGGATTPAVFVAGVENVPSTWRISGIECVIDSVPEIKNRSSMSGIVSFEGWKVRFTNYGTDDGTTMPISLLDINRRLARAFPADRTTYMARTEVTFESASAALS